MKTVTTIQENAEDILAEAKQINKEREEAECCECAECVVEETAEEDVLKEENSQDTETSNE